ncbi:hypothetical protein WL88_30035 [Burkholderia diffusa]|uniref:Uncharacterized protein n=1 Tax=Burkholderia diffusa TaxID=488732 RepID=A0AAW3P624_9BURK|nr:hypothetical protein [Burkholderia diffusa]KWF33619.1 hypothetical protein WL86_26595 [Burkholderia diffusa]KWF33938.1 hypothetical protein WL85_18315 [Burkholderia diffusa]KWF44027.1 hypothetical protein WL88_30035 [Burkholderia diffusa]KWF54195.1 hypothetical protein WL87_12010 [Burkholderia diffusa]
MRGAAETADPFHSVAARASRRVFPQRSTAARNIPVSSNESFRLTWKDARHSHIYFVVLHDKQYEVLLSAPCMSPGVASMAGLPFRCMQ